MTFAALLLVSLVSQVVFADQEKGAKLYVAKQCITCHQAGGKGSGPFPNLAGKDSAFIQENFINIQSGTRTTGMSSVMKANPGVQSVTNEEIAEIADYLSNLK